MKTQNLLPLGVHVVVDLLVGDGQHHDEDPQQHHADHELVEDPHWHHRPVDGVSAQLPDQDAVGHVVSRHAGQIPKQDSADPEVDSNNFKRQKVCFLFSTET